MPIESLSSDTSRALTSAQTLNDAVSIVKELVDNALDARASSIAIEIASNTLDRITVRDDGCGIGVQDRQFLCRRGYTSKIANLDDLAKLGGTFLGFRGTALASIAELSKSVTIITRVDGERPATSLTFGPRGSLTSSSSASHNVGTTVRVEDFLVAVPVRQQRVSGNPAKVLDQIRKLLQSYALARPTVKIILKVLKAKNDKQNWSFAACREESSLLAAVGQVVGKVVADACRVHSTRWNQDPALSGFKIEGVVIEPSSKDLTKCSNIGQYLSVDGRPINETREFGKRLVKTYKSYLRNIVPSNISVPSKPFLIIRLSCVRGSYDVNVEPAKDVVLFHNKEEISKVVDEFFSEIYGALVTETTSRADQSIVSPPQQDSSSFDVLLARRRPEDGAQRTNQTVTTTIPGAETERQVPGSSIDFSESANSSSAALRSRDVNPTSRQDSRAKLSFKNMHAIDADEELVSRPSTLQPFETLHNDDDLDSRDARIHNPFTKAKMNSLQTPKKLVAQASQSNMTDNYQSSPRFLVDDSISPNHQEVTASGFIPMHLNRPLPTPESSPQHAEPYQNPGPPLPRRAKRDLDNEDEDEDEDEDSWANSHRPDSTNKSFHDHQSMLTGWVREFGRDGLASGFQNTSDSHQHIPNSDQDHTPTKVELQTTAKPRLFSQSLRTANRPFKSPLKEPRLGVSPQNRLQDNSVTSNRPLYAANTGLGTSQDDDLEQILDFEHRKRALKEYESNQRRMHKANAARLQHNASSGTAAPSAKSSQSPSFARATQLSNLGDHHSSSFGSTEKSNSLLSRSNPHQNRYAAAIRNLQSPRRNQSVTSTMQPTDVSERSVLSDAIMLEQNQSIAKSDPRGYLISHGRQVQAGSHSHPHEAQLHVKRVNSSKLPLESIHTNERKHDLLALPDKTFPAIADLSSSTQALVKQDTYVRKGKAELVRLSAASRHIQVWQEVIEALIRTNFRTITTNDTLTQEGHFQDDLPNDKMLPPNFQVPLAKILKIHNDLL